ncbi:PREDICTED: natural cytotoxicity triggering receptor 3 ligand 1-like [Nanorana parkeri]|uniref:natural cytotoxicity triggering receptor 3 ligand 1-like n=1 Tax=Nanorana parkeri TaxID=125878 RepID=UPI000853F32E|nr:PREDICTED: natural cytotoxicity triggering receptor 3 ligand 1-like [Nanorana parkeri]
MRMPRVLSPRDGDVTIPCDISDLNTERAISLLWRRSENDTVHDVYENIDGVVKSFRPGCSVDVTEFRRGNAELRIPRVQFSDEGEYTCTVINTPDKAEGRSTLEVSVPPSAEVTPADPTIELGTEKTMMCDVHNFYPKDVSIRWAQYRKGSSECELLDIWTCAKSVLENSDGTFNVTSLLTLNPTMEDNGNTYSCLITHRSLQNELSRNFTLTVTEREDNRGAVIGAVLVTLLSVGLLGIFGFLYVRFIKKVSPKLLSVMAPGRVIHDEQVTLTCPINAFKPRALTITWLKKDRNQQETELVTWTPAGSTTHNEKYSHNLKGDEHEDKSYSVLSALTMKATVTDDDGVTYICRTFHPATNLRDQREETMRVTAVPVLDPILKVQEVVHVGEKLDLSCRIHSFYPRDIQVTWYTEDDVIIPSQTTDPLQEYGHLCHVSSTSSYTPTMEDLGKNVRCEVRHDSLWRPKHAILTLTHIVSVPTLGDIRSDPAQPEPGEPVTFSCEIRDMYPGDPAIQWQSSVMDLPAHEVDFKKDPKSGTFSGTTTVTFIPQASDHSSEISLEVNHCGKPLLKKTHMYLKGIVPQPPHPPPTPV